MTETQKPENLKQQLELLKQTMENEKVDHLCKISSLNGTILSQAEQIDGLKKIIADQQKEDMETAVVATETEPVSKLLLHHEKLDEQVSKLLQRHDELQSSLLLVKDFEAKAKIATEKIQQLEEALAVAQKETSSLRLLQKTTKDLNANLSPMLQMLKDANCEVNRMKKESKKIADRIWELEQKSNNEDSDSDESDSDNSDTDESSYEYETESDDEEGLEEKIKQFDKEKKSIDESLQKLKKSLSDRGDRLSALEKSFAKDVESKKALKSATDSVKSCVVTASTLTKRVDILEKIVSDVSKKLERNSDTDTSDSDNDDDDKGKNVDEKKKVKAAEKSSDDQKKFVWKVVINSDCFAADVKLCRNEEELKLFQNTFVEAEKVLRPQNRDVPLFTLGVPEKWHFVNPSKK